MTSAAGRAGPGVLLVDDDPFMLNIQSLMLLGMGLPRVLTADCGSDALRLLQTVPEQIDLIVCDLNMPGMDGIEFLQAANANRPQVSVILLSGEGTRIMHTVQKLLGKGGLTILGALEKPTTQAALKAVLDRWQAPRGPTPKRDLAVFGDDDVKEAARRQQWLLHYQPKVDLRSGALAGVEALVRWQHPVHGLVYPDRFIGVAEECGAIDELTDWVCRHAVQQLTQWRALGMRVPVSVNVSMENLRAPNFARRLGEMVRAAGVAPQMLTLEITESRLMSPAPAPLESLVRLRLQRFGLSIDDFGTGHSSLAQLRDVPFTELKVDRGFVDGAHANPITKPMLEGSIGIAKRLGMQSVGEGVESEDDWRLLSEIGCDLAQGYFIARPMAADALPAWLGQWEQRRARLVAP